MTLTGTIVNLLRIVVAPPPPEPPPCFVAGTRILTPSGEVPVERLEIGDLVTCHDGNAKPVRWIGRRRFTGAGGTWPQAFVPVRVRRGALGPGCPHRDLLLSPGHMIYIDDVLVAVEHLVDGRSIVVETPGCGATVEYFHIELDGHDLLVSEGAPTGSLRAGPAKRERFGNFAEYDRLYPNDDRRKPAPCAPIYPSGLTRAVSRLTGKPHACRRIAAIRRTLAKRTLDPVA